MMNDASRKRNNPVVDANRGVRDKAADRFFNISAFSICLTTAILLQIKTPQFDEICDAGLVVCLHLPGEGADSYLLVDAQVKLERQILLHCEIKL